MECLTAESPTKKQETIRGTADAVAMEGVGQSMRKKTKAVVMDLERGGQEVSI